MKLRLRVPGSARDFLVLHGKMGGQAVGRFPTLNTLAVNHVYSAFTDDNNGLSSSPPVTRRRVGAASALGAVTLWQRDRPASWSGSGSHYFVV